MLAVERHAEKLGRLVANMQALEFILRVFLHNTEIGSVPKSPELYEMNVGDMVAVNALTNYDNLHQLIKRYNSHPKIKATGLAIDESLVDTRDAVAHGRVSSATPSLELRILKFSKPKDSKVKVTYAASMNKEWFKEQIPRFYHAFSIVLEANNRLKSGTL